MEGLGLDLSLLLQTVNNILVAPTNLVGETLQESYSKGHYFQELVQTYLHGAVFASRLEAQYPEGLRDDHALLAVVRGRNALEKLEAFQSCRAASSLVGDHAADGPVEDLGGCTMVEGAGLFGVDDVALVQEVVVPQLQRVWLNAMFLVRIDTNPNMHLVAEETARNVNLLAPDDDNLLAVEDLLRDNRSKAAQKMALAVNDNGGGGEGGHGASDTSVGAKRVRTPNFWRQTRELTWGGELYESRTAVSARTQLEYLKLSP